MAKELYADLMHDTLDMAAKRDNAGYINLGSVAAMYSSVSVSRLYSSAASRLTSSATDQRQPVNSISSPCIVAMASLILDIALS